MTTTVENRKFVKPLTMGDKAYFVVATIGMVTRQGNKNFGMFTLSTDMQYNTFEEKIQNKEYFTEEEAQEILNDLNFIEVKNDFDIHSTEDIRTIKSKLSQEWIENYNLWIDYTG